MLQIYVKTHYVKYKFHSNKYQWYKMYSIFIVFRLLLKVNLICLKRNSHNVDYETYHYDYFNTF